MANVFIWLGCVLVFNTEYHNCSDGTKERSQGIKHLVLLPHQTLEGHDHSQGLNSQTSCGLHFQSHDVVTNNFPKAFVC